MRVELWHLQGREKLQDGAPGSGRVWAGVKAVNLGDWADVTRRQDPGGAGLGTWTGRRVHGHMDMLRGMLVDLRPAHPPEDPCWRLGPRASASRWEMSLWGEGGHSGRECRARAAQAEQSLRRAGEEKWMDRLSRPRKLGALWNSPFADSMTSGRPPLSLGAWAGVGCGGPRLPGVSWCRLGGGIDVQRQTGGRGPRAAQACGLSSQG